MLRIIGDRFLRLRLQQDEKIMQLSLLVFGVIIILLFLNTLYLTYNLGKNKAEQKRTIEQLSVVTPSPFLSPQPTSTQTQFYQPQPTLPKETIIQTQNTDSPLVKEYFIPMGTGTSKSDEWENVAGTETSADFGQYKNIKEIRFETSVTVPSSSQLVWVRLWNITDKHPVWYSEVTTKGETSAYLVSQPIIYDIGQKIYQVQIKTQLKGLTNLVQSRIHITLQ